MRNHLSLFSFSLPLSYLERKFVPKYNPHIFRVQRVSWSLGNFGDLPKKAGKAWRMQSGVLRDPENQKRHDSEKPCWSRSLEGLGTLGKLGLEGLLLVVYPNLLFSGSIYRLGGSGEVFRRILQFFSITHRRIILYLYFSSLTPMLSFYCYVLMNMAQSSFIIYPLIFTLFRTQISQSKSNLVIIFNWESKQALVFSHIFKLS